MIEIGTVTGKAMVGTYGPRPSVRLGMGPEKNRKPKRRPHL